MLGVVHLEIRKAVYFSLQYVSIGTWEGNHCMVVALVVEG